MKPEFKNRGNEEVELKDGRKVWLSRSPAAVLVVLGIYKDNIFVLIEKRSQTMTDAPGEYALISGYIDYNETSWEACVREAYEETGLNILQYKSLFINDDYSQPFFVNSDPQENRQNIALNHCIIIDFSKKLPKEIESYTNEEISEVKWLPIEYVQKYKFAFKHKERIYQAIEKYQHMLI
jgi:8-oxo-dGTP pyrophosphatase MutT (NUDIX family)